MTVIIELKARFGEENNIEWAKQLEECGVHVVYGLVGLKTHCKLALVIRYKVTTRAIEELARRIQPRLSKN